MDVGRRRRRSEKTFKENSVQETGDEDEGWETIFDVAERKAKPFSGN